MIFKKFNSLKIDLDLMGIDNSEYDKKEDDDVKIENCHITKKNTESKIK